MNSILCCSFIAQTGIIATRPSEVSNFHQAEQIMAKGTHAQVEFQVGDDTFRTFDDAVAHAVMRALTDGRPRCVDVLVWSERGAEWWGGNNAVGRYREDPDASVFERIQIKAEYQGQIP